MFWPIILKWYIILLHVGISLFLWTDVLKNFQHETLFADVEFMQKRVRTHHLLHSVLLIYALIVSLNILYNLSLIVKEKRLAKRGSRFLFINFMQIFTWVNILWHIYVNLLILMCRKLSCKTITIICELRSLSLSLT